MKLLSSSRGATVPSAVAPVTLTARRPVYACASCRLAREPFVYLENGRDYCRPCAIRCWNEMRLRPAGHRPTDITLDELLA